VKVKREKGGMVGRKRLGLEREGREEGVWVIKTQNIKHRFSFLQSPVHATWQSLGSLLDKTQLLYIYIYV
jgi:hypothetical protein